MSGAMRDSPATTTKKVNNIRFIHYYFKIFPNYKSKWQAISGKWNKKRPDPFGSPTLTYH
jgi:hypothetical protein